MEVLLSAFRLQVYYSITDLRRIFLQSESAQIEDNRKQGN